MPPCPQLLGLREFMRGEDSDWSPSASAPGSLENVMSNQISAPSLPSYLPLSLTLSNAWAVKSIIPLLESFLKPWDFKLP